VESDVSTLQNSMNSVQSDVDAVESKVESFIDGQYAYVKSQMTWNAANDYCAATYGTTLATIKNDVDAAAVLAMKDLYGPADVWIGLNDINTEGTWEWASGYACDSSSDCVDYWNTNEPNDYSSGEDCGHIRSGATSIDLMLNDRRCDYGSTAHFICDAEVLGPRVNSLESNVDSVETDVSTLQGSMTEVESDIDAVELDIAAVEADIDVAEADIDAAEADIDAVEADIDMVKAFVYGQYAYVESQKIWSDANDYCAATYGTSLATIKNDGDAEAALAIKALHGSNHVWVGLNDMNTEGDWVWASGYECQATNDSDCVDYWNINEPNDYSTGEDCGHILSSATSIDLMLNDLPCNYDSVNHFMCDVEVLGPRVNALESDVDAVESDVDAVESRVDSLERVINAINVATDSGMTMGPLGLGDYALYGLALANLAVLVCLMVYCVFVRMTTPAKYGKVAMYESETDRV